MSRAARAAPWLLVAVFIATVLRVLQLDQNSLWIDEFASMRVASVPLSRIPAAALEGSAYEPPIYFWLLHLGIALFGTSESALRALSVVAGIATVPLVWLLVRELTGQTRSAAFAALLLAVNPLHLWYSQEARPYTLALLFAVASLLCVRFAMSNPRVAAWAGYTVFGALAILSHVTLIIVPAVGAAWVALDGRRWRLAPQFVAASAGIVVLIAPFLLALGNSIEPDSVGSPPRALTGLEVPYSLFTYVAGYSFGPSVREIQNLGWWAAVERHLLQTLIAGGALVLVAAIVPRAPRNTVWQLGVLLMVPLVVSVLGALVTSKAFNVRYTLLGLIGFVSLMGMAIAALEPRAGRVALAGLLAVSLWADAQWLLLPRYWKEDTRAAVDCLAGWRLANDTVAVAPGYMRGVVEYYAARAGHQTEVLGVATAEELAMSSAKALLTTRLHHVPDEAALVRVFRGRVGPTLLEGTVPGYRIHARPPEGKAPPAVVCRTAE